MKPFEMIKIFTKERGRGLYNMDCVFKTIKKNKFWDFIGAMYAYDAKDA